MNEIVFVDLLDLCVDDSVDDDYDECKFDE